MLFTVFAEQIKEAVLEKLGEGYKAEVATVVQNNGVKAVKLSICREGEQVACSVCLDTIYSKYFLGKITIEQAAEKIFSVYQKPNGLVSNIEENTLRNWNQIKDKVCYRLVQFDKNCGELQKRPYRLYADLAVVYYLLLAKEGDGMFTVAIMTQHMLAWGVGEEELYLQASKNTPSIFQ